LSHYRFGNAQDLVVALAISAIGFAEFEDTWTFLKHTTDCRGARALGFLVLPLALAHPLDVIFAPSPVALLVYELVYVFDFEAEKLPNFDTGDLRKLSRRVVSYPRG
jgi:hypothetical protein